MENINIEECIITNFNEMVRKDSSLKEISAYTMQIREGLDFIKKNNQLNTLTLIYLIVQNLHKELNNANKIISIKYNITFETVTPAIFFALGYNQNCYRFGFSKNNYTCLSVPQEFYKKVIDILESNSKYWKNIFKIEIRE